MWIPFKNKRRLFLDSDNNSDNNGDNNGDNNKEKSFSDTLYGALIKIYRDKFPDLVYYRSNGDLVGLLSSNFSNGNLKSFSTLLDDINNDRDHLSYDKVSVFLNLWLFNMRKIVFFSFLDDKNIDLDKINSGNDINDDFYESLSKDYSEYTFSNETIEKIKGDKLPLETIVFLFALNKKANKKDDKLSIGMAA
jgi:hypothetical protein